VFKNPTSIAHQIKNEFSTGGTDGGLFVGHQRGESIPTNSGFFLANTNISATPPDTTGQANSIQRGVATPLTNIPPVVTSPQQIVTNNLSGIRFGFKVESSVAATSGSNTSNTTVNSTPRTNQKAVIPREATLIDTVSLSGPDQTATTNTSGFHGYQCTSPNGTFSATPMDISPGGGRSAASMNSFSSLNPKVPNQNATANTSGVHVGSQFASPDVSRSTTPMRSFSSLVTNQNTTTNTSGVHVGSQFTSPDVSRSITPMSSFSSLVPNQTATTNTSGVHVGYQFASPGVVGSATPMSSFSSLVPNQTATTNTSGVHVGYQFASPGVGGSATPMRSFSSLVTNQNATANTSGVHVGYQFALPSGTTSGSNANNEIIITSPAGSTTEATNLSGATIAPNNIVVRSQDVLDLSSAKPAPGEKKSGWSILRNKSGSLLFGNTTNVSNTTTTRDDNGSALACNDGDEMNTEETVLDVPPVINRLNSFSSIRGTTNSSDMNIFSGTTSTYPWNMVATSADAQPATTRRTLVQVLLLDVFHQIHYVL
jgi:hypothetical protein